MSTSEIIINAEDVLLQINQSDLVIFDCRFYLDDTSKGRKEFLGLHIPRAVYLDTAYDLSSPVIEGVTGRHPLPHPAVLASTLRAAGLNNNTQVIVYDQSNGVYASRAWWLLHWLGHNNVKVINGGFDAWLSINGPLDNEWSLPAKGDFVENVRNDLTVDRFQLSDFSNTVIDSRDHKRFTGEVELIDPVAGHIPAAICIPYMDNTDANGLWKSVEALQSKFLNYRIEDPPVFYCGSGITACHNILAYKRATGIDALLYPGSWSEWINYHKVKSKT